MLTSSAGLPAFRVPGRPLCSNGVLLFCSLNKYKESNSSCFLKVTEDKQRSGRVHKIRCIEQVQTVQRERNLFLLRVFLVVFQLFLLAMPALLNRGKTQNPEEIPSKTEISAVTKVASLEKIEQKIPKVLDAKVFKDFCYLEVQKLNFRN